MSIENALIGNSTTQVQTNAYSRQLLRFNCVGTTIAAALTRYISRATRIPSATEEASASYYFVPPIAGSVLGFGYGTAAAPGAGETFDATLRQNKGNFGTNITVQLSGATGRRGSFATNVSFSAGDKIGCQIITSAGAAATTHGVWALLRFNE